MWALGSWEADRLERLQEEIQVGIIHYLNPLSHYIMVCVAANLMFGQYAVFWLEILWWAVAWITGVDVQKLAGMVGSSWKRICVSLFVSVVGDHLVLWMLKCTPGEGKEDEGHPQSWVWWSEHYKEINVCWRNPSNVRWRHERVDLDKHGAWIVTWILGLSKI